MPAASVVITNHDYGPFIGEAIDSALAQAPSRVEVVVVDDGSQDDSRRIISRYGAAIRSVFQEHQGQAQAMLAGLRASTGDVILFLDSDDVLYPGALARIGERFGARVAKVQARLDLIDDHGRRVGRRTPSVPMPSGDLGPVVRKHGWYPAPPTSGNAFARATLEALLPVPERYARLRNAEGRLAISDHYLSVLGALCGDVVSIREPVGAYRIHAARRARRRTALLAEIRRRIAVAAVLSDLVRSGAATRGLGVSARLEVGTPNRAKERLASLILDPAAHPVAADTRWSLLRAGVAAAWSVPWSPRRLRLWQTAGLVALAALPRSAIAPLLSEVVLDEERPRWVSRLVGMEV